MKLNQKQENHIQYLGQHKEMLRVKSKLKTEAFLRVNAACLDSAKGKKCYQKAENFLIFTNDIMNQGWY